MNIFCKVTNIKTSRPKSLNKLSEKVLLYVKLLKVRFVLLSFCLILHTAALVCCCHQNTNIQQLQLWQKET